jgi:hypothetical protein
MTLLCKKKINNVAKSKMVKTGCNMAKSSKEDYGSDRVVLPMMIGFAKLQIKYLGNT